MAAFHLRVIAKITALPEHRTALQKLIASVVEPTRKEPGCISYQVYQSADNKDEFVCLEEWVDDAAMQTHLQSEHIRAAFASAVAMLAAPPEIKTYRWIA